MRWVRVGERGGETGEDGWRGGALETPRAYEFNMHCVWLMRSDLQIPIFVLCSFRVLSFRILCAYELLQESSWV